MAPGLVTVVLRDALTKSEQALVSHGREDVVATGRRELQAVMRPEMVEAVERLTGHRVVAFLGDHHVGSDYSVENFILERSDTSAAVDQQTG